MDCNPEILLHRATGKPKISVILIDWGVRESFHCLHYLNRQTARRDDYELIWLEFYDRKPEGLKRVVSESERMLDKWYVLGYPNDFIFHKHRLYNVGVLAAAGDICVICDSDAIFSPTFIENLLGAFKETPRGVIHIDEVRNIDQRYYPFNYPAIEDILGPGCINWQGTTSSGLSTDVDRIHGANYGACMAARRRDILAVGGADEHLDYLGYVCGPYDLTFRLANYHGRPERWLQNEFIYHAWHPNTAGCNFDYHGPHDGRFMSSPALQARTTGRVEPYRRSPLFNGARLSGATPSSDGALCDMEHVLDFLKTHDEPSWRVGRQPAESRQGVYLIEKRFRGYKVFVQAGRFFAVDRRVKTFDPQTAGTNGYGSYLEAASWDELLALMDARREARLLNRVRRKVFAQPLHRLPIRAWRRSRRALSSLWPA
jgi:hypothetical protein